jgi:hypothetical protein
MTRKELERLAGEANDLVPETEGETWFCPEHLTKDDRFAPEDATFIAATSPATILSLLSERAELLEALLAAEDKHQRGIFNMTDAEIERVHTLRRAAIRKATDTGREG